MTTISGKINIKAHLDTDQATDKAEKLNRVLEKSQRAATSSSKALDAAKAKSELSDYGKQRASGGGTGAEARDFSKQARGLGGVVHLYATYAANVFAVSSAFMALSKAQDTANMVKGLDQLGAASGVGLGTLSKQLVKATDNAVSLREAMEATVKASSSGMSNKDILRMGEVAKKASQALGVDMSDALSRISRGISKLEPELLDELGILTRMDPAVAAYAKQVGKSVSSLSQFERQMAFANAVLEEGERKFGAINIETNAYTKLLANLKDMATGVGSAINTVMVPIINVLNSSPMALYGVIAGLVGLVLKQAIPALGSMRASLAGTLEDAKKASQVKLGGFGEMRTKIIQAEKEKLTEAADTFAERWGRAMEKVDSVTGKGSVALRQLKEHMNMENVTEDAVRAIEKQAEKAERAGQKNAAVYKEIAVATRQAFDAEKAYQDGIKNMDSRVEKEAQKQLGYRSLMTDMARQHAEQVKINILQEATANARSMSAAEAIKKVWIDVGKARADATKAQKDKIAETGDASAVSSTGKFGRIDAITTGVKGTLGVMTEKASALLNIYGVWGQALAVAAGLFGVIDGWLDKASSKVAKFNESLEEGATSAKLLGDYLNLQKGYNFDEIYNSKNVAAYSTALLNVSNSLQGIKRDADAARDALADSWWSRAKNSINSLFGGGVDKNEASAVAKILTENLKDMERNAPIKTAESFERIKSILGVKSFSNVEELTKNAEKLDKVALSKLIKEFKEITVKAGESNNTIKEFETSLTKASDSHKTLMDQFKNKDPLTKFAEDAYAALFNLNMALYESAEAATVALNKIEGSSGSITIFGSMSKEAKELISQFKEVAKARDDLIENRSKQVSEAEKGLSAAGLPGQMVNSIKANPQGNVQLGLHQGREQIAAVNNYRNVLSEYNTKQFKGNLDAITAQGNNMLGQLKAVVSKASTEAAGIIMNAIDISMKRGATAFREAVLSSIGNLPGVGRAKAGMANQELALENKMLDTQIQILLQTGLTAQNTNRLALLQEKALIKDDPAEAGRTTQIAAELERSRNAIAALGNIAKNPKAIMDAARAGSKDGTASPELLSLAQALAGYQGKKNANSSKMAANAFSGRQEEIAAKYDQRSKELDIEGTHLDKAKQSLELEKTKSHLIAQSTIDKELQVRLEEISLNSRKKENDIDKEIELRKHQLSAERSKEIRDSLNSEISRLNETKKVNREQSEISASMAKQNSLLDGQKAALARLADEQKSEKLRDSTKEEKAKTDIGNKEQAIAILEAKKEIADIDSRIIDNAKQMAETAKINLDYETKTAEIKRQTALEVASIPVNASDEYKESREAEILANAAAQEAAATSQRDNALGLLDIQTQISEQLAAQTEQMQLMTDLSNSMNVVFGERLGTIGKIFEIELENSIALAKAREGEKEAEENFFKIAADKKSTQADINKAREIANKASLKTQKTELDGNIKLISGAKSLFKEKSAGYKILEAAEKAMHLMKMANAVREIIMEQQSLVAKAPTLVTGIFAKLTEQLGIYGPIAAAAIIAAIGLSGGGGTNVDVEAISAQAVQERQGTGGVLGDPKAINKDVLVSIENLNKLNLQGNNTAFNMLTYLEKIEYNTKQAVTELFKVPGIFSGESAFGTMEGEKAPILGLFGGRSTSIIDGGIKAMNKLADGVIQWGQYETVHKKSSGFLGIGGSSKVNVNTKELPDSTARQLNLVLDGMVKASAAGISQIFGSNIADLTKDIFKSIDPEALKVSLKDMDADKATEAIMGVFGAAVSDVIEGMYPFMSQFQQLGEGLMGTALRLAGEYDYVTTAIKRVGAQMTLLPHVMIEPAQEMFDKVEALKTKVEEAKKKSEEIKAFMPADFDGPGATPIQRHIANSGEYAKALRELEDAEAELNDARSKNIQQNLWLTQELIKNAGGIENFSEQVNFYLDNLASPFEKLTSGADVLNRNSEAIARENANLAISYDTTRAELVELIKAQDLNTEAGRQAYQALMDHANTIVRVRDEFDEFFGGLTGSMVSAFNKGLEQGNSAKEIGQHVAAMFVYGIEKKVYDATMQSIFTRIYDTMINPILNVLLTGGTAADAIAKITSNSIVETVTNMAKELAVLFDSEEWKKLMNTIKTSIAPAVSSIASIAAPIRPLAPVLNKVTTSANDTNKALEEVKKKFEELNKKLIQTAKSAFDNAFSRAISKFKSMESELKSTVSGLTSFIKSMRDFKTSILLGDTSTMTAAQKYVMAKTDFETTLSKAKLGDQDARDKLQDVSQNFLDASRQYYASGEQYAADFASVLSAVDLAIDAATDDKTVAEEQLKTIQNTLTALGSIDDTLLSIEEILVTAFGEASSAILDYMKHNSMSEVTMQQLLDAGIGNERQLRILFEQLDFNRDNKLQVEELTVLKNLGEAASAIREALAAPSAYSTQIASEAGLKAFGTRTAELFGERYLFSESGAFAYTSGKEGVIIQLKNGQRITAADAHRALLTEGALMLEQGLGKELYEIVHAAGLDAQMVSLLTGLAENAIKQFMDARGDADLINQAANATQQANTDWYTTAVAALETGGAVAAYESLVSAGKTSADVAAQMGLTQAEILAWAQQNGLPAFAKGTNYVPEDMLAVVHRGERIVPEADNTELIQAARSSNNAELVKEIKRLNERIAKLEEAVIRGSVINAQATDRNTEAVVAAVDNNGNKQVNKLLQAERAILR